MNVVIMCTNVHLFHYFDFTSIVNYHAMKDILLLGKVKVVMIPDRGVGFYRLVRSGYY